MQHRSPLSMLTKLNVCIHPVILISHTMYCFPQWPMLYFHFKSGPYPYRQMTGMKLQRGFTVHLSRLAVDLLGIHLISYIPCYSIIWSYSYSFSWHPVIAGKDSSAVRSNRDYLLSCISFFKGRRGLKAQSFSHNHIELLTWSFHNCICAIYFNCNSFICFVYHCV